MKGRSIILLLVLSVLILTSCQNQTNENKPPTAIKVLTWNEELFFNKYGTVFLATHPEIDLEVISLTNFSNPHEEMATLIQEKNPDVLVLDMDIYNRLRDQNMLLPLTTLIKKDDLDLEDFAPAVVNYLKDGNGELFGLTPVFSGKALFYNKKLFETYGIPLPTDSMTWDEVFQLAKRFPKTNDNGEPLYGLYDAQLSNPLLMSLKIGENSGLSIYNNNKLTLNSTAWQRIFQDVADCLASKVCWNEKKADDGGMRIDQLKARNYPFADGNIAMAIIDSDKYKRMIKTEYNDLDWGIVTHPVRAEQRDTGNGLYLSDIFAINSNSGHKDEAWQFVKYVNGKDYERLLHRTSPYDLQVRMPSDNPQDMNIEAFYKLHHLTNSMTDILRSLPEEAVMRIEEIYERQFADVFLNKRTVPEALDSVQFELEKIVEGSE